MHPLKSPITVYVVVTTGIAVTDVPVELLSVAAGLQIYVFAPLAVSVVDCPEQTVAGATVTAGRGLTVTATCVDPVHPLLSVPVTVYVVVEIGFAVTGEPVVALSAVAGVQEYVFAPLAVSVVDCPLQIVTGATVITGRGFTVTVTCVDAEQPLLSVPVTVYVMVAVGLDVTDEPVAALSAVAGVQEYVEAPFAVSVVDCPLQIVTGATVTTGRGLTVTVTCTVAVHPFEVPVTVYVVVVVGFAITGEPVELLKLPEGLQT